MNRGTVPKWSALQQLKKKKDEGNTALVSNMDESYKPNIEEIQENADD